MIQGNYIEPNNQELRIVTKLTFKSTGESITKIKLAQNDTFVASVWIQSAMHHIFKHMNKKAQTKLKLQFPVKGLNNFFMASPHEVVIVAKQPKNKHAQIILWNIIKNMYIVKKISLIFEDEYPSNIEAIFYKNTNMFCLCEVSRQQRFNFNYLRVPFGKNQKLLTYTFSTSQKQDKYQIWKLDQFSKIAIISKNCHLNTFQMRILRLNKDLENVQIEKIYMKLDIQTEEAIYLSCRITDIWEVDDNILYVQCQTFYNLKEYEKQPTKEPLDKEKERYYNFFFNSNNLTCKKGQFNPAYSHRLQFINSIRQVNYLENPNRKKLQESKENYNRNIISAREQVPIYYINYQDQKIFAINKFIKAENQEFHMRWTDYKSFKMMVITQNLSTREITIKVWQFLHFL